MDASAVEVAQDDAREAEEGLGEGYADGDEEVGGCAGVGGDVAWGFGERCVWLELEDEHDVACFDAGLFVK